MLQWYAMVWHDLSTRVSSSRHQVPTTDIISARCRCRLYCRFSAPSSNMSSRPCCEIHSRISRACQCFRKDGFLKLLVSVFPALENSNCHFSKHLFILMCVKSQHMIHIEWDCCWWWGWSYQTRRWQGWRRPRRWAESCRWTGWWTPMWSRWSWKLCRWTWKLENVICFLLINGCF